ncbi:MAG: hypothetical protein P8104_11635, partial [Gammaproteobacteria bacterium]
MKIFSRKLPPLVLFVLTCLLSVGLVSGIVEGKPNRTSQYGVAYTGDGFSDGTSDGKAFSVFRKENVGFRLEISSDFEWDGITGETLETVASSLFERTRLHYTEISNALFRGNIQ